MPLQQIDREIDDLQKSPSTRDWLRQALTSTQGLDPIDASHDAQRLADLLARRADALLQGAATQGKSNDELVKG